MEWMLHQQFRWNFHRIHLAVVLFNHPLKNQARFLTRGIGHVSQSADKLAGSHLKQLNSREPLIRSHGNHIPTDR